MPKQHKFTCPCGNVFIVTVKDGKIITKKIRKPAKPDPDDLLAILADDPPPVDPNAEPEFDEIDPDPEDES